MAKGKKGKLNPKTHGPAKKQGKSGDATKFSAQLAALGLRIVHVTADGNCFFRAIADQLEGNEEEHMKYRRMVVQYIMDHRKDFEPFIEDEVPFDEYCKSMQDDGTWAGHMELQAASLVTQTNICIHRLMSPRWNIHNFDKVGTRSLHLSYHDGEHYNSIRWENDDNLGPAKLIVIEANADLVPCYPRKDKLVKSETASAKRTYDQASVKLVLVGTGCTDVDKVHHVLQEVHGDTDAAIEFLIAEQNAKISAVQDAVHTCPEAISNGVYEDENRPNRISAGETMAFNKEACSSEDEEDRQEREQCIANGNVPSLQKVARNKACPCGSKKKYKACCGVVRKKPNARITMTQEILSNKTRKQRHRNAKSEPVSSPSCSTSIEGPTDLGALYI